MFNMALANTCSALTVIAGISHEKLAAPEILKWGGAGGVKTSCDHNSSFISLHVQPRFSESRWKPYRLGKYPVAKQPGIGVNIITLV
jgi:hypothetical protein